MKVERTKNATRNIVFGFALKIYQLVVPFLMRTAMIYFMGVQYLGLNSLFTSILQVLNLAELGVGGAMVYSMYKPIAEDDKVTICALMRLYKKYYRIIGGAIAVVGIIITPLIPSLVKKDLPAGLNIYVLYLLNLAATVLSYWLFAYKNSLFQAHQRLDVTSKVAILTNTFQYAVQFLTIYLKNYYLYVIATLFTQALTNIITAVVATKMYPEYRAEGNLDKNTIKAINKKIKDLFTSKIGGTISNSADTIIISAFLGLTVLAVYQNYYYILSSIAGFIYIIFQSTTAGIGNSVVVETKEKNLDDLKKFTFMICWIAGFCCACFLCLYQPFMELWVGRELMLEYPIVICLCVYFFVQEVNQLLNTYKDAAGIWHEDRFRPLISSLANLAMNLVMVQFWGLYGVILSTILSMSLIGTPWLLHNLFTTLFSREYLGGYLKRLLLYTSMTIISCVACYFTCLFKFESLWGTLIFRLAVCCVIPNWLFSIVYRKLPEYMECKVMVKRALKVKFLGKQSSKEH